MFISCFLIINGSSLDYKALRVKASRFPSGLWKKNRGFI